MASETERAEQASGWTQLPSSEASEAAAAAPAHGEPRPSTERLRAAMKEGASQVATATAEVASRLSEGVKKASAAFDAPQGTQLEGLLEGADLPSLAAEDAVAALALRLDREADFWRGLALRALARGQWADRVGLGVATLAAIGGAALAVVAGLGALFGAAGGSRALLVLSGMAVLAVAAAVVAWVSSGIRRAQRELARDATAHADLAELRLHRVAILLALRKEGGEVARDALLRLERDVAAPPRAR